MAFKLKTSAKVNTNNNILGNLVTVRPIYLTPKQNPHKETHRTPRNKQIGKPSIPTRYRVTNEYMKLKHLTVENSIQSEITNPHRVIPPRITNNNKEIKQQSDLKKLHEQKHVFDRSQLLIFANTSDSKTETNREEEMKDTVISQLETLDNHREKLNEMVSHTKENDKKIIETQGTLDLLNKIKESPSARTIGPMPLSLQVCSYL